MFPARSIAWAFSREGARPRSTFRTSRRDFPGRDFVRGLLFVILSRVGWDFILRVLAEKLNCDVRPGTERAGEGALRERHKHRVREALWLRDRWRSREISPVRIAPDRWLSVVLGLCPRFFPTLRRIPKRPGCRPPLETPSRFGHRNAASVRRLHRQRHRQSRRRQSSRKSKLLSSIGGYITELRLLPAFSRF